MKKIVITVTDAKAAEILGLIITEVDEITVTRVGPDSDEPPAEKTQRKMYRGDKTARALVLEMFDDENKVRSREAISAHLVKIGFGENTGSATISQMVADGLLTRLSRDALQIVETPET